MLDKVVINFTPKGMIPTKKMTPYVPVSVSEIIEDVYQVSERGITLVHLHARDAETEELTHRKEIEFKTPTTLYLFGLIWDH